MEDRAHCLRRAWMKIALMVDRILRLVQLDSVQGIESSGIDREYD